LDPDDESLMRHVSPVRFEAAVAPGLAARLEGRGADWRRVEAAMEWWQENCDVLLVEGAGGWYVPLDEHDFMVADLAAALRLPVLVVTHAALGTINETLLTLHAIGQRNLAVAGMVVNRVAEEGKRDLAMRTNLEELPRLSGATVRAVLEEARGEEVVESLVEGMMAFAREWWEEGKCGMLNGWGRGKKK
jgi:dethiobiotin synthetase